MMMERSAINEKPWGYQDADPAQIPQSVRDAINERRYPILLTGPPGTGKTSTAACKFATFTKRSMWHRADDLLLAMAVGRSGTVQVESYTESGELRRNEIAFARFVTRVNETCSLFLDDLGIRPPTPPMQQALFDILEWRKGKPVFITTNHKLPGLNDIGYDSRITDRLRTGTVIQLTGKSQRTNGPLVKV